ncbi:MAG: hypothetical protein IIB03_04465 [Acidobacteria bacterium]|nr:hypothetical protein [Acidobacteriota bacterium]
MMPEIDGYEVLRHMKSQKATKDIPVIMLTALNMDSQVAASFYDELSIILRNHFREWYFVHVSDRRCEWEITVKKKLPFPDHREKQLLLLALKEVWGQPR